MYTGNISIEDELRATPGVFDASVNVGTQEATVKYLPEKTVLAQLDAAIEAWGYKTSPAISEEPVDQQQAEHEREYRRLMSRFWLAAIIAIPVLFPFFGLLLNPLLAGAAMAFSSVTVVGNANRLRSFRPKFSVR